MTKSRHINPENIAKPFGYTHVVEVLSGRPVYISGQVALDLAGNMVGPNDYHAQTVQVFENLKAALASVNATFENVVKFGIFLLDADQLPIVREVRDRYINTQQPPASTAVQVSRLFREGFLIEIEAVAIIPV